MKRYFILIFSICIFAFGCSDDFKNPKLNEDELNIYLYGNGANIDFLGTQGFTTLVNEKLVIELMVSPVNGTACKWIDKATGEVLCEGLVFEYLPVKDESRTVIFTAERSNGYRRSVEIKLRTTRPGMLVAEKGSWLAAEFTEGAQTGKFTAKMKVMPTNNAINSIVGLSDRTAKAYSDYSVLIRFGTDQKIAVYNGTTSSYSAEQDMTYQPNLEYLFDVDVNVVAGTYSVKLTASSGGPSVTLATDYKFRSAATKLTHWTANSESAQAWEGNGILSLYERNIETISQNNAPVIEAPQSIIINEGEIREYIIKTYNPLGGDVSLRAANMPRYAFFADNGDNTAILTLKPYDGGVDLGSSKITIYATNQLGEISSSDVNITVDGPIVIISEVTDGMVRSDGGIINPGDNLITVGTDNSRYNVAIIPFKVPTLDAGMEFKSAELSLTCGYSVAWAATRCDIYALPARTSSALLQSDYYLGLSADATSATLLKESYFIINGIKATDVLTTDNAMSAALASQMNSARAGEFIFIRVNTQDATPNWAMVKFHASGAVDAALRPTLKITTGKR